MIFKCQRIACLDRICQFKKLFCTVTDVNNKTGNIQGGAPVRPVLSALDFRRFSKSLSANQNRGHSRVMLESYIINHS